MSTQTNDAGGKTIAAKVADSFQNLLARVGLGAGSQNDGSNYGFSPISRNRIQLEFAYRSSWIAGKSVDAFADDMTREGVNVKCDIEPDKLEQLEKAAGKLKIWDAINDTTKWSRLYGGAIAVMLIDGQNPSTPLRKDTIQKDQFKGLLVLDRWMIQPTLEDLVTDYGPDLGKPKYYKILADAQALVNQNIHYSRVLRLDGVELPYWQRIAENGWGQSVLERLWDRLVAFDSTTEGAAQLVYKAHLRTYKVKGLRQIIGAGGKAFDGLIAQIDAIRQFQTNEGMTLMDAEDTFETHSYSFAGLNDVLLQFGQQLSGAIDIPLVRLFGQSPAGLNATGESDLRNYYDSIKQQQERKLRSAVETIYNVLYRSTFGEAPPANMAIEFNPLWQVSDTEKATIANSVTDAVTKASDSGLIDRHTALKELRQSSAVTGVFSNITDEDIKEAENEPPPDFNEVGNEGEDLDNETNPKPGTSEASREDIRPAT